MIKRIRHKDIEGYLIEEKSSEDEMGRRIRIFSTQKGKLQDFIRVRRMGFSTEEIIRRILDVKPLPHKVYTKSFYERIVVID